MSEKEHVPKLSVCVVTYNHEKYIGKCLQSIAEQETDFSFEVIVGDDCSTDGTRAIVLEYVEKYPHLFKLVFHPQNVGPTKNYLSVHAQATGELVCHCDGDDYWLPTKLQVQATFMVANPACNVSGHRMYQTDDGRTLSPDGRKDIPSRMNMSAFYKYGNFLPHSSTMYRASAGRTPDVIETYDFLLHIWRVRNGEIGFINQYLGVYRKHDASLSVSMHKSLRYFNFKLAALEEIHKVVQDTEEFEKRKFALAADSIKNYSANGNRSLVKEVARASGKFISKRRYGAVLWLMTFVGPFIGLAVRMKRRIL